VQRSCGFLVAAPTVPLNWHCNLCPGGAIDDASMPACCIGLKATLTVDDGHTTPPLCWPHKRLLSKAPGAYHSSHVWRKAVEEGPEIVQTTSVDSDWVFAGKRLHVAATYGHLPAYKPLAPSSVTAGDGAGLRGLVRLSTGWPHAPAGVIGSS
jgi:hypothetical protein